MKAIITSLFFTILIFILVNESKKVQQQDYIYYSSEGYSNGAKGRDIIRMSPDGSLKNKLTSNNGKNHYPHHINAKLSPNGKKIVYQSDIDRHDSYTIWVMNEDGSNKQKITKEEGMYPNWSADGNQIVFSGRRNGVWEIIIIPSVGGKEKIISKNLEKGNKPGWGATCTFNPNGKTLVYSYVREKILYLLDLNTEKISQLTNSKDKYTHPIFSKDGSNIAVNRKTTNSNSYDLILIKPDGTETKVISKNIISYSPPAWSDLGNELLFSGMVDGNQQLFKIDLDTKKETMLTSKPFFNAMPTW